MICLWKEKCCWGKYKYLILYVLILFLYNIRALFQLLILSGVPKLSKIPVGWKLCSSHEWRYVELDGYTLKYQFDDILGWYKAGWLEKGISKQME